MTTAAPVGQLEVQLGLISMSFKVIGHTLHNSLYGVPLTVLTFDRTGLTIKVGMI